MTRVYYVDTLFCIHVDEIEICVFVSKCALTHTITHECVLIRVYYVDTLLCIQVDEIEICVSVK